MKMKIRKSLLSCLLIACVLLSLTACGQGGDKPAQEPSAGQEVPAGGGAEPERTFAIVYPIVHPFFEPIGVAAVK